MNGKVHKGDMGKTATLEKEREEAGLACLGNVPQGRGYFLKPQEYGTSSLEKKKKKTQKPLLSLAGGQGQR